LLGNHVGNEETTPHQLSSLLGNHIGEEKTETKAKLPIADLLGKHIGNEETSQNQLSSLLGNHIGEEEQTTPNHLTRLLGAHHLREGEKTSPAKTQKETFSGILKGEDCKSDMSCCMTLPDENEMFPACRPQDTIKHHEGDDFADCKKHCTVDDKCYMVEQFDKTCAYHMTRCTAFDEQSEKAYKTCNDGSVEYEGLCNLECKNHGVLVATEDECRCECDGYYKGDECETFSCPLSDPPHCAGPEVYSTCTGPLSHHVKNTCPNTCGLCMGGHPIGPL